VYWLSILFFPFIKILDFIPRMTQKIHPPSGMSEAELLTVVEMVEEEGEIKEEERELIHNIFRFDDTSASEIMTPRADMFVIDINKPLDFQAIAASGFTRIPVIDEDMDHVIGVINIKDLFSRQVPCHDSVDIRSIMREAYFVPENKKLDSLLRQFKKRKNHIAIVVDEHGGVSGLISLEDVLEEIVGEISDETDMDEAHIVRIKPNEWAVLGKTEIEKVNETIPLHIPDSPDYDTFSGFVLSRIGRIPHENEEIEIHPFRIVVKEMDGNRIKKYLVKQVADQPSSESLVNG
jgi:CBS domain containing-hemolysin-like protein